MTPERITELLRDATYRAPELNFELPAGELVEILQLARTAQAAQRRLAEVLADLEAAHQHIDTLRRRVSSLSAEARR